jgi:hypothetical protein
VEVLSIVYGIVTHFIKQVLLVSNLRFLAEGGAIFRVMQLQFGSMKMLRVCMPIKEKAYLASSGAIILVLHCMTAPMPIMKYKKQGVTHDDVTI